MRRNRAWPSPWPHR